MEFLRQINRILTPRDRRKLALLLLGMILLGVMEMAGVASIMPFIAVVADPDIIHSNRWLAEVYLRMGFESDRSMLLFLGTVVLVALALRNAFSAAVTYYMFRFAWDKNHEVSMRLLQKYLGKSYSYYLDRHSSSLSMNILSEVQAMVNGSLIPSLKIVSSGTIALSIIILLVVADPVLALAVVITLGGLYGILFALVRRRISEGARARLRANRGRYKAANEAFAGIKLVKAFGRERAFAHRFERHSRRFTRQIARNKLIGQLPSFFLETITFGGILLIVLYVLSTREEAAVVLGMLSLYAFAGYRLLPNIQTIYSGWTQVRLQSPAVEVICRDLEEERDPADFVTHEDEVEPIPVLHEVAADSIVFRYPNAEAESLDDVTIHIPRNHTVAIVGETGSGKTTLVDVLLGLLETQSGGIAVDGRRLAPSEMPAWRASVGYVPQETYLTDDTIGRNIAFGIPPERVDQAAVERAARVAHLHDFITTLERGYESKVGERGVRLSGGQRQRVGIARALYADPQVLFLDEATSALDLATENEVMGAIRELAFRKTIVIVAHRISTVRGAHTIYLLERGRITASGSYEDLVRSSPRFREMARHAEFAPVS